MNLVLNIAFEWGDNVAGILKGKDSPYSMLNSKKWNQLQLIVIDEIENTCDHELTVIDDSFDHEFGTEECSHFECKKCGAEIS